MFEKKKIQIETLSEYLSAVRLNLNMSQEDVSKKIGISLKFLNALEKGDLKALPADVYVYGFLRQLAEIYVIDKDLLIEQYKKERHIAYQISSSPVNIKDARKSHFFSKLVITPKILSFILGGIFVVGSACYIIWQVWSINKAPSLVILEPLNNSVVESSFVKVVGKTDPGMSIVVNEQIIFVDSNGNFQTQLGLSPGPKEIVVTARNRFNKILSQTLNITGASVSEVLMGLQLKVDLSSEVAIDISIDGNPSETWNFNKGDSKLFIAKKQVLISTTNAGATKLILNGQLLGAMGRPGEELKNVTFFAPIANTVEEIKQGE